MYSLKNLYNLIIGKLQNLQILLSLIFVGQSKTLDTNTCLLVILIFFYLLGLLLEKSQNIRF
ncbi:MAG: hypothetical protein EBW14_19510 [Oxalobacteraceae bacterium]|nr:hypothetical protein [Oxalobacteraceae bacterium]